MTSQHASLTAARLSAAFSASHPSLPNRFRIYSRLGRLGRHSDGASEEAKRTVSASSWSGRVASRPIAPQ